MHRRWANWFAAFIVAGFGFAAAAPERASAVADFSKAAFCNLKKPVRDFGFSRLPAVNDVPVEEDGLLGHGAVGIYGGRSRVMTEPASFGFSFYEHTYTDDGVRLDWTITAQLWAVSPSGERLAEVDHGELRIGQLRDQPDISLDPLQGRRGFYRYDLQIANAGGDEAASYSAYFKVVQPSWKPRLRLARDQLQPGQRLLARIDNHGTEGVSFGESFSIQRAEGADWVRVPELTDHPWLMWLGWLAPGGSSRCNALVLPPDLPVGRYRFVKSVGTLEWPKGRAKSLPAQFDVLGASTVY